jgi:hypothetical protein
VAIVLSLAVISYLGYYNARYTGIDWLHQGLAAVSGGIYFICIFFGPFYIYTVSYMRGVSLPWRILASSFVPFIWISKDVLVIMESHPLMECLYWYFNPLSIWMVCLLMIEMGAGTLLARAILKRQDPAVKVVTTAPLATALIGLVAFAGIYAWGQGENIFSIFLHGYRLLFGSGV